METTCNVCKREIELNPRQICDACMKDINEVVIDVGHFRTKYGSRFSNTPESFLSITSRSEPQKHSGAYVSGSNEYVGKEMLFRWPHINFSHSGHHEANLINFAKRLLHTPNTRFFHKAYPIPEIKPILIADYVLIREPVEKFNFRELAKYINNGIVIDFGHTDIRLFAVHKFQTIINSSLGFGGFQLGAFLRKLMLQYNRSIDLRGIFCENPRQYIACHIKEDECAVFPDFQEDIKKFGVHNWKENVSKLVADKESLMSTLPTDILATITKMMAMNCRNEIESLGWAFDVAASESGKAADFWEYNIGAEKHFVMEALFQPHLMGEKRMGLIEKLKALISLCESRNDTLEKKIVLCGGMVHCSGLLERIAKEMPDYTITAEEHLFWQTASKYLNKVRNT